MTDRRPDDSPRPVPDPIPLQAVNGVYQPVAQADGAASGDDERITSHVSAPSGLGARASAPPEAPFSDTTGAGASGGTAPPSSWELPPRKPRRANTAFMLAHPSRWIALGFGSGLSPVAPGTVGTLWAWWSYHWLAHWLTPMQLGVWIAASAVVGVWACWRTAQDLGQSDPGAIVWDEIVAFWLVLWLIMPTSFGAQCVAFLMFRFFDAAKPGPVRWADRVFKGDGWRGAFGILWDDLVAAGCVLLLIALWRY